jgi:hypothetical protein
MTREDWLLQLTDALRPMFLEAGAKIPEKVRATCGWPSKSARPSKNRRIGEAWSDKCSADETYEVFISPCLADPIEVAGVMVHELVHTAVGVEVGHKAPFKRVAQAIGLEGKMTATVVGEGLRVKLEGITAEIGPYPHAVLDITSAKKQTTRQLKIVCSACGYICRTTAKWIEVGTPTCACGTKMQAV